jgi:hypothetical protein
MTQQTHITYHKPTHKPLTTAHEGELANNPALDLTEDQHCPTCNRKLFRNSPCPFCSFSSSINFDAPIVFVSPRHEYYSRSVYNSDGIPTEELSPDVEDLPTYILGQIGSELTPDERPIAAHILTSLDPYYESPH